MYHTFAGNQPGKVWVFLNSQQLQLQLELESAAMNIVRNRHGKRYSGKDVATGQASHAVGFSTANGFHISFSTPYVENDDNETRENYSVHIRVEELASAIKFLKHCEQLDTQSMYKHITTSKSPGCEILKQLREALT